MSFKVSSLTAKKLEKLSDDGSVEVTSVGCKKEHGHYIDPLVEESFKRRNIKPLFRAYFQDSWYYFGKKAG